MPLPTPDPAFHWTAEPWGHALRCIPLESLAQHAFTTRQLKLRAAPELQARSWTQAAASVGAGPEQVLRVKQQHGALVRVIRKSEATATVVAERPDADALVSNASGFVLSVQVADCVPILIADPETGAVAAVHAGWRGTCAAVVGAAIAALVREFASDPRDLHAAIGPSIGPCCYEVGQSVLDEFRLVGVPEDRLSAWFSARDAGSLWLDLPAANRDQLTAAGLRDDQIYSCGLCTKTHRDLFESYRADGPEAGRMAALIKVP